MSEYPKHEPQQYQQPYQQPNQPQYQQPYQQPYMVAMAPPTNTMAVVGFILSFVFSLAGLIVSIIALNQIKRTGEGGRGLALAGVIISSVAVAFAVLYLIFVFAFIIPLSSGYSDYNFVLGF